jgi:urea transport system permease protein
LIFLLAAALFTADARAAGPRDFLVQALTTNDIDAQIKLIQKLTDAQDPMVAQGLAAWRQGGVFLRDSGNAKVPFLLDAVTDSAGKARGIDIASGETIKDAAGNPLLFLATDLTAVDTTSKLRKAIKTTLDVLALSSLNPNIRRDAASKLGLEQNRDYLAYFQTHLETEKVPAVRKALEEAAAITQLASDQPDVRLAAVRTLDRLRSVTALDLILKLENDNAAGSKNADPGLLTALRLARKDIEEHISWGNFIGTCFRGLSLSAVLLIAALGLAITFGLMGIINMAHGEMIMIGAYSAYLAQNVFVKWFGQGTRGFDWYFIAALPFSFVTAGLVGLLLERGVIRFLYKRPLESLLATWGVSLVLQQLMRAIFGAANVQVYSPSWLSGNITYEDVSFPHNRIFVIGFALGIVALTWLLLTKTSLGLQVRAVMQNRQMAACLGVRIDRVNMATFAFGSGLAGMAGACLSQIGNIGPSLGQSHIVDCFMVVVLGGVGNLVGTVSAALGIGVTDQVLQPHLGAVLGKITVLSAIILFLQWRPAGLFAARSRSLD